MHTWTHGMIAACLCAWSACAGADADGLDWSLRGLLDLRYLDTGGQAAALNGGLGKFRYSGERVLVNQAALVAQARLNWDWSASVTGKYAYAQDNPIDFSEALLQYRPVGDSAWRLSGRFGAFLPPVSLENSGLAWSSPYTLSNSAINSWIGEEVKVFGSELQLNYQFAPGNKIGLFAAGFGNNDTAGVLLAWRGWDLSDYVAGFGDSYQVPKSVNIAGLFPKQAAQTQPFSEVDNQPGYYVGFNIESSQRLKLRGMFYDNRGNPSVSRMGQYSWHTRFGNLGLKLQLPWNFELIGESLLGETQMGAERGGLFAVDTTFWAESLLLSWAYRQHRLSVRYDDFGASGHDYLPQDPTSETGHAVTCNYNFTFAEHHQLNLEFSQIDSQRASRAELGLTPGQNQTLWQIAYRFFF